MALAGRIFPYRLLVIFALMVMLLMRMVWLQLRDYPITYDPRAVVVFQQVQEDFRPQCFPDYPFERQAPPPIAVKRAEWTLGSPLYRLIAVTACEWQLLEESQIAKLNQWLVMLSVAFVALAIRFLTSSWTIAITAGVAILSRGRLLSELGYISHEHFFVPMLMAWCAGVVHFVRTGSNVNLACMLLLTSALVLTDRAALTLGLVFPVLLLTGVAVRKRLARPILARLRQLTRERRLQKSSLRNQQERQKRKRLITPGLKLIGGLLGIDRRDVDRSANDWRPSYERGSLFRTLEVPFGLWIFIRRRWLRLGGFWLAVTGLAYLSLQIAIVASETGLGVSAMPNWGQPVASDPIHLSVNWLVAWFRQVWQPVDLHYGVSLGIIALCMVQSPARGLPGFFEAAWLLAGALALTLIGSVWLDIREAGIAEALTSRQQLESLSLAFKPRRVLVWFEPMVLALAIAGFVHLLRVIDQRLSEGN